MVINGESERIIDVRDHDKYNLFHIEGAENIPFNLLEKCAFEVLDDKYAMIYIYCDTGLLSAKAAELLNDMGYYNIFDFGRMDKFNAEQDN
ncbi:MAG: rhodanese-like domain-containing protein [Christensenellaceae bacterium]